MAMWFGNGSAPYRDLLLRTLIHNSHSHTMHSWQSQRPKAEEPRELEASLNQFIRHHKHTSLMLRRHTEKAKKDAMRKAARISDLMVEAVNGGVQRSFTIQNLIEHEIGALAATVSRFVKRTDQWLAATHALNTAVKEIGDFENWMKTMEYDCKSITAAIQNIYQE